MSQITKTQFDLRAMYESGMTIEEIALEEDMSTWTVRRRLREADTTMRRVGSRTGVRHNTPAKTGRGKPSPGKVRQVKSQPRGHRRRGRVTPRP